MRLPVILINDCWEYIIEVEVICFTAAWMVSVVVLVAVGLQLEYLGPGKFIDQGSTRKSLRRVADMAQTKSSLASTPLSH